MAHIIGNAAANSVANSMLGGMWGAVPIETHAVADSVEHAFSAWSHATRAAPIAVVDPVANAVEKSVDHRPTKYIKSNFYIDWNSTGILKIKAIKRHLIFLHNAWWHVWDAVANPVAN